MRPGGAALAAVLIVGCGGAPPAPPPKIEREGPEAQILRIGSVWEARQGGKSFRSKPDPVTVFEVQTTSTIFLVRGERTAKEEIVVRELFQMRAGGQFLCEAQGKVRVQIKYGQKGDDPAIEIARSPKTLSRVCDPPGYPEPTVDLPHGASRFVLRGDQLVGFAPPLEKRLYLPME